MSDRYIIGNRYVTLQEATDSELNGYKKYLNSICRGSEDILVNEQLARVTEEIDSR